jgi:hypothetical protein
MNTESEATQRAGASPHPPLDTLSRARGPPTRHSAHLTRGRGPPTRHTAPRSGLVPRITAKVSRRDAPPLGTETKPPDHRRSSNQHIAFPRTKPPPSSQRPGKSPTPSSDDVPHRESSVVLKTPPRSAVGQVITSCRCRKRRRNAVPHRTGACQATPGAAKCCKRPKRCPSEDSRPPTEKQTS